MAKKSRSTMTSASADSKVAHPPPPSPTDTEPTRAWSPEVIDLSGLESLRGDKASSTAGKPSMPAQPGIRVRLKHHASPLDTMTDRRQMRLYIRVICELVAYGEEDAEIALHPAQPGVTAF